MGKRNYNYYKDEEMDAMQRHCCDKCKERDNSRCKCEHEKGHDKKDGADVVGFDFDTFKPNKDQFNQLLPEDMPFQVAAVTLNNVKEGDLVWLNGVLGLENRSGDAGADVSIRIYKGNPPSFVSGQEIYKSDYDIDTRDDETVAPLSHVDVIKGNEKCVTYTLVLVAEDDDIYLIGPKTFTGLQIRR